MRHCIDWSYALSNLTTARVPEITSKNFGLLIAYVLPGFVALWGLQPVSAMIRGWLSPVPTLPGGVEAIAFVTVASITAGMTVSAFRWAIVDALHALLGLPRPQWDDANLQDKLDAFDLIVEAHYRYYQFYANTFVAAGIAFVTATATHQPWTRSPLHLVAFAVIESIFLAMSYDALRKYYHRTSRLLGIVPSTRKEVNHGKRQ